MVNTLHKIKDTNLEKFERLKDFIITTMIKFFTKWKDNALVFAYSILEWENAHINIDQDDFAHLKSICVMKEVPENKLDIVKHVLKISGIKNLSLFQTVWNFTEEEWRQEDDDSELNESPNNIEQNDAEVININNESEENESEVEQEENFDGKSDQDIQPKNPSEYKMPQKSEVVLLAHWANNNLFSSYNPEDNMNIDARNIELTRIGENLTAVPSTEDDFDKLTVTKRLIDAYFSIQKKQIKDLIQKAMVCQFFNKIDSMSEYINDELYSYGDDVIQLLIEADKIVKEREKLTTRKYILTKALKLLNTTANADQDKDMKRLENFINLQRANIQKESDETDEQDPVPSNLAGNEERFNQESNNGQLGRNFEEEVKLKKDKRPK